MFKLQDKESNYYAQIVQLDQGSKHTNADSLWIWNVNNLLMGWIYTLFM